MSSSPKADSSPYRGAWPQSRRAAASSTSAGQLSTIACRFSSTAVVSFAPGNAARTIASTSPAVGANAPMLYTVRVSRSRGAAASRRIASTASGMAMNGMPVSGHTKQAYGFPSAAAWIISGA